MHTFKPRAGHTRILLLLLIIAGGGCEGLGDAGAAPGWSFLNPGRANEEEAEQRNRFLTEGDPEAIRWLLRNRVSNGMSLAEVNRVLGQEGVRQYDDGWIKNYSSARFRQGDQVYKWGPDNNAQTYFLVFRDRKLVNFKPGEYE